MTDLLLIPTKKTTQRNDERIERIGQLHDLAEQLLAAPVRDIPAIVRLAVEMREFGLIKASRILLDKVGK